MVFLATLALGLAGCSLFGSESIKEPPNEDPGEPPVQTGNLLDNPGFEELEGGVPVGWNGYVRNPETSKFMASPINVSGEAAYSGNVGVVLEDVVSYIQQTVNIESFRGQTLEVTAWQKGDGGGQIKFEYVCYNPETERSITCREENNSFTATADWQKVSFTTDVAEGIEIAGGLTVVPDSVRILVRLTNTRSIYYDDLSFHPVE